MPSALRASNERYTFATLVLVTLAPVVLQGVYRPLAQLAHADINSFFITSASLFVAIVVPISHRLSGRRFLPLIVASGMAVAIGPVVATGVAATGVVALSLLAIGIFSSLLLPWLLHRLPVDLDGLASANRKTTATLVLFGVAAVFMTTRLAVFMGDSARADLSLVPDIPFLVHHSCLTAYVEGARLASAGADNLYNMARWPDLNGTPRDEMYTGNYAPFGLDAFAYPPPFLLLPLAAVSWLQDFASQRAVWFSLNGLVLAFGLWNVANWLRDRGGNNGDSAGAPVRTLLLAPVVWASTPVLGTLQVGNVHLVVMVAAMLALVAFETRRHAVGGALLAFAVLSKISPGLLVLILLVRGRFREVLWTGAFAVAYSGLGLLVFGANPFLNFVQYELPRLSSGEALNFLAHADTVPINLAPFGIPFKLAFLGFDVADPWAVARHIGQGFTLAIVAVTLWAARRNTGPRATAEMWAAVLTLASLRSPLAPGYVTFALLWLLSFHASEVRTVARGLAVAATWLALVVIPPSDPTQIAYVTFGQQAIVLGATTYFLLRRSSDQNVPG